MLERSKKNCGKMELATFLNKLYLSLNRLEAKHPGKRKMTYRLPNGKDYLKIPGLPNRGIYIFFEKGEIRKKGKELRIVRVGTHGLNSQNTPSLIRRLKKHRGSLQTRIGNINNSVFRKLVAQAFYRNVCIKRTIPLEKKVTEYIIRAMSFLILPVDSFQSRKRIEKQLIGVLSNCLHPIDPPSSKWLGRNNPDIRIVQSGLWNKDYVCSLCEDLYQGDAEREPECEKEKSISRHEHRFKGEYDWLNDLIKEIEKAVQKFPDLSNANQKN